jgi:poly(A) polymerase
MPESLPVTADKDRAAAALERAVACAESGRADRGVVLVSPEDLGELSPADVRSRLDRVLMGSHADAGLDALLSGGVLDALLPEVKDMVGFGDGEWRHKDVWRHTKQVVTQSVPRLEVRYAALFHDIGKVRTRSISPEGEVHFFGHAEVGARMLDKLERRERLFREEGALFHRVRFLVLHHLRASQYDGKWTDSAVRRFARETGAYLDDLLCLSRADITTKRPEKKRRGIAMIDELAGRISVLAREDARRPALPTGLGNELMVAFGIPPSKKLGDLKRALEAAVEAGEIEGGLEAGAYVELVARDRRRFGLD